MALEFKGDWEKGERLTAAWVKRQELESKTGASLNIRGAGSVSVSKNATGITIRGMGGDEYPGGRLVKATTTITARVGTTPGQGEAELYLLDSDAVAIDEADKFLMVWNYTDTIIAVGEYCLAIYDPQAKEYWVVVNDAEGVLFRNDSGLVIPPHGIVFAQSSFLLGDRSIVSGARPTTYFDNFYLVNGPAAVPALGYAYGTYLSESGRVAYSGTPAAGEEFGPKPNSFLAHQGRLGFIIVGATTTVDGTAVVTAKQHPILFAMGKVYGADITPSGSGTVRIYLEPEAGGDMTDSTQEVTVNGWMQGPAGGASATRRTLTENTRVTIQFYSNKWRIANAHCESDDDISSGGS